MSALDTFLWLPLTVLGQFARLIEYFLYKLIHWYDDYVYSPLQTALWPIVEIIPRHVTIRGQKRDIFTANIVSWSRTFLVVPVAWCLKYEYYITAFVLVLLHDFLDHLDGIVAKVQKQVYGQLDDPLLGGFMDAFCDKIVNVTALWTILVVTNFGPMTSQAVVVFVFSCAIIITFEFVLGVVRVQDYFRAYYDRKYNKDQQKTSSVNTAAVMEGKLKEKLESMGIAFLCLAQSSHNVMESISGIGGILCLVLSIRLAHASLQHKLKSRKKSEGDKENTTKDQETATKITRDTSSTSSLNSEKDPDIIKEDNEKQVENENKNEDENRYEEQMSDVNLHNIANLLKRQQSVPNLNMDGRVDKVYSIGCFDLFHQGHICLLQRLKAMGRQVIIGVHDSRSIFKLKKRVPIDSTEKRMKNVKQYADVVYCIAGTDPTPFLSCIIHRNDGCSSMYVRGDDMQNFPAKELCEQLMPIAFLPYSKGVSSTKLRKEQHNASKFGPHVQNEDHALFY